MNWIKEWIIKKFLVGVIVNWLDKLFQYVGKDGSKTLVGAFVAVLGIVLLHLPDSAPYIQPILEYLKTLPAEKLVEGGLLYQVVGVLHKLIKSVKKRLDTNLNPEVPTSPA